MRNVFVFEIEADDGIIKELVDIFKTMGEVRVYEEEPKYTFGLRVAISVKTNRKREEFERIIGEVLSKQNEKV